MRLRLLLVVAAFSIPCTANSTTPTPPPTQIVDPGVFYTMVEIVCSDGYSVQEHVLQTEDGYILTIHRIPNAKRRPKIPRKRTHYQNVHRGYHPDFERCVNESRSETATGSPVLIAHGLFVASDSWVLQGPKYDLAYMLVDEGYDVWFTNIRGNFYSRNHVRIRPSDPTFWDFSFHEFGKYDMTATIDYVLNVTGYKKLFYIGHSMGTTMFFTMASTRPEYNDKIQLFTGLAPVGQLKEEHLSTVRAAPAKAAFLFVKRFHDQGVVEILPRTTIQGVAAKTFCGRGSRFQNLCYDLAFAFNGYPSKLYLRKILPMIVSHSFSGASIKTLQHFEQTMTAPSFRCFDHGREENLRRYGQPEPPEYDLKKVTAPVALYYSVDDYIVDYKDSELLMSLLPNVVASDKIVSEKYSHTDFVWAYNAKAVVYNKILELLIKFRIQ